MLVLSRKINEAIVINDRITVTILAISSSRIRVGIDAPLEVPILRGELQSLLPLGQRALSAPPV